MSVPETLSVVEGEPEVLICATLSAVDSTERFIQVAIFPRDKTGLLFWKLYIKVPRDYT